MGNAFSAASDCAEELSNSLVFKRTKLCATCIISYSDVFLDAFNAYTLFKQGDRYWGACMTALLFLPNFLTWQFLYASGVASWTELPMVLLQLGPLYGLRGSWKDGELHSELVWYMASEGLLEAPCTGILTAYIMTFGGEFTLTFYISVIASFFSIAKTAVTINFYGQSPSLLEQGTEFLSRFFDVALRVSSLACFAYLLRQPNDVDEASAEDASVESAIQTWLLISFVTSACMISMAEPLCPMRVSVFFGACMVFTPPLRFLDVFERMMVPFVVYRAVETLGLLSLASFPLQINPQLWELLDNCPFMVSLVLGSATCQLVFYVIKIAVLMCRTYCCRNSYQEITGYNALKRAEDLQNKLVESSKRNDVLMTNLLVHFGAKLDDAKVVNEVLAHFPENACEDLKSKGMPHSLSCYGLKELLDINANIGLMREAGFKATDMIQAGADAAKLKAGFEASELKQVGFDAKQLKQGGFEVKELLKEAFEPKELEQEGILKIIEGKFQKGPGDKLGIDVDYADGETLRVDGVNYGLVSRWNDENPGMRVAAQDVITAINGVSGDSQKMLEQVKQVKQGEITMMIYREL